MKKSWIPVLVWLVVALPPCGSGSAGADEDIYSLFRGERTQPDSPVRAHSVYGGDWRVQEGEVHVTGGPGPKLISHEPVIADGAVGVELFLSDKRAGNAALVVRVSEPGIGADSFIGYEVALDANSQVLRLGRHRHDFTLIRDVPCPVPG